MKKPSESISSPCHCSHIEREMLLSVLANEAPFPWNPSESIVSEQLDNLEANFGQWDLPEEIFESRWNNLLKQAEQLWASQSTSSVVTVV